MSNGDHHDYSPVCENSQRKLARFPALRLWTRRHYHFIGHSEASTPLSRAKIRGNESPHSIGVSVKARDPSESEAVISSKVFCLGRAQVALMCRRRPKEQAMDLPLIARVERISVRRIISCEAFRTSSSAILIPSRLLGRADDPFPL